MGHALIDPALRIGRAVEPEDDEVFVLPATVGQQGFWYLDQLDPGNPAYNIAVRFRLEGPLLYPALVRALNEIVRRHESLRTAIVDDDGQPVQVVSPSLAIPVPVVDLTGVPPADRHARSEELAVEEARQRFALAVGPLIRAALLRLGEDHHILLVTVHHIISDGWSIGVITQELGALYDAFCRRLDSPLNDLPLQYGDFAVWQARSLGSNPWGIQLAYWARQLAQLPLLEIPTDRPRPPIQSSNGHIESILLPRALTEALKDLSHRQGVTFFMVALAAIKVVLGRSSGQTDLFVGTLTAGRTRVELEPLIGLFVNPLVLRTNLAGDPSISELLDRVRETVLSALDNQDVPFERVAAALRTRRDPSRHPVFQINFIFQRDFVQPFQASGLTLTAIPSRSPGAIYDLNFFMVERAEVWRASCEYNTDLYDAATVNRMLGQWQAILQDFVVDRSRRISALGRPTAEESESGMGTPVAAPPALPTAQRRAVPPIVLPAHDLPRDEIEVRLAELWTEILGLGRLDVDLDADFFDQGGHSLLAARLLARIERAFGRRINLAAFLQAPTIRSVAADLREPKQRTLRDRVFAIQPEGNRVPIILVDAGPLFRPLARRLGSDQPMFGLLLPELAALPDRFTLEDITTNLLEVLKVARPRGPYILGGWSMAGVLAYDMAQQLRARGEDVSFLLLFDVSNPRYLRSFQEFRAAPIRWLFLLQRFFYHLGNIRRMSPGLALRYASARIDAIRKRWRSKTLRLSYRLWNRRAIADFRDAAALQYLIAREYDPQPYAGKAVLFRSAVLQTGRFRDPRLGWGTALAGGLDIHEMPGEHDTMLREPDVERLARILTEYLSPAAEPAGSALSGNSTR